MSILERVKQLQLPEGEYVVIGSGLLDAWGIRVTQDIDLAVSDTLYKILRASGQYTIEEKFDDELLTGSDIEIWRDWKADAPFEVLSKTAVEIDGIKFVHPDILLKRKMERGTPKDIKDIELLKEHLTK